MDSFTAFSRGVDRAIIGIVAFAILNLCLTYPKIANAERERNRLSFRLNIGARKNVIIVREHVAQVEDRKTSAAKIHCRKRKNMSMSSGYGGSNPVGVRTAAIGEAWAVVQQNLGAWIGATAIYLVIGVILNVLQRKLGTHVDASGQLAGSSAMGLLLGLVSVIVGAVFAAGFVKMALKQLRGENPSAGDVLSATDAVLPVIGFNLLSGIIIGIATIFCIVPGFIMSGLLMLGVPLIVDGKGGTMEGLSRSFAALKPHWVGALVFVLALIVVNIIGAIPCGLGLLITIPISAIAVVLVYQDFFGGGTNTLNNNANLYPPIPNIPQ